MKVQFNQLFETLPDGGISPKIMVQFNGKTFPPDRVLREGHSFGGIDLRRHVGEEVELEKEGEIGVIMGFYPEWY